MLKLTNAVEQYEGQPLLLNSDFIVSVYGTVDEKDNDISVIYSSIQQTWFVKETVEQIFEMM